MSNNTQPKEKKPLKLNNKSEAFDLSQSNSLTVKVEETKIITNEVKPSSTSNPKQLPNPSRFQTFFEYPDGKGFYIEEGGVQIDFKFDRYQGWYDEYKNYYNKDGKPDIPPSDEDDDLSRSDHSDNDLSSQSYDSGEEYYHDPLLDEYDIYGREEENYSDDDQYDIMGMATQIRMLDSQHDIQIEFENAPFQFSEKQIQDVFEKVTIKQVFKDQGSGYIICPGVDEALKAIKFHKSQLKSGVQSFDLRLNVDYIDDLIQADNVRVVKNNATPSSSTTTEATGAKDNKNQQNDQKTTKKETNNNSSNKEVPQQTQSQNNGVEQKEETKIEPKNNSTKNEEQQVEVKEEVKEESPEPAEDKILLDETKQFNIKADKSTKVEDIKHKLNALADLQCDKHYKIQSADLKKGKIVLIFNKDYLVSIQKALRGEKAVEPEQIAELPPAETQVESVANKEGAAEPQDDGFITSTDNQQQKNKNK